MNRYRLAVLCVAAVVALALVGCGGGGGGSTPSSGGGTEEPTSGRTITGTVVSSADGKGVDNVVIRLGSASVTTADGGKFSISVDDGTELPTYFEVDTSSAGSEFPGTEFVTYMNETHYPNQVDLPVGVLNETTNSLGTITVTEVTGDPLPPAPYPTKDILIYGRVLSQATGEGIQGVSVSFGYSPTKTAQTGKMGYFAINTGQAGVLTLFANATWPYTFSVDTSNAVGSFPSTLKVSLAGGTATSQSSVSVPDTALYATDSMSLGSIIVLDSGSDDSDDGSGDEPPAPPF